MGLIYWNCSWVDRRLARGKVMRAADMVCWWISFSAFSWRRWRLVVRMLGLGGGALLASILVAFVGAVILVWITRS